MTKTTRDYIEIRVDLSLGPVFTGVDFAQPMFTGPSQGRIAAAEPAGGMIGTIGHFPTLPLPPLLKRAFSSLRRA
jgi:hypothetical protein